MAHIFRFMCFTMMLASSSVAANADVGGLTVGESKLTSVKSGYKITKLAVISNVRKSVYEMPVDQLDIDEFFTKEMLRSITLYFNEKSVLSDIHLVYGDWEFSDLLDDLDSRFGIESERYSLYGRESVIYSWPNYTVNCYKDRESGNTHVIFSENRA